MKLTTLSQLESEALMKDRMNTVKGGGDPSRDDKCASCVCPRKEDELYDDTYEAAYKFVINPDV